MFEGQQVRFILLEKGEFNMGTYAKDTNVSSELSRLEIEKTLVRYGASGFAYATQTGRAMIAFMLEGRQVRFILPLPDINADEFRYTPTKRIERSEKAQFDAWEQECRRCWRALLLVVKAKLEAIETGISTFDSEFMANIVLPSGETVGDWMEPQIEKAYLTGQIPEMLPMLNG